MSDPDLSRTTQAHATHGPEADGSVDGAGGPATTGAGGASGGRRRRRSSPLWLQIVVLVVVVLIVAAVVADHIELDYYVLTPGDARPVAPLVEVPKDRAHPVHGGVYLTDVYVTQVTALSYLYDKVRGDSQLLPAVTVLGPAAPPSQLLDQGYLQMQESQSAAKTAALTRLGYHVHVRDTGVVIYAVVPGSPASKSLAVGRIVRAVDGHTTTNACAFSRALGQQRAGEVVKLTVERSQVNSEAAIVPGPNVEESVKLARWPSSVPHPTSTPSCPGTGWHDQGFLGVEGLTQQAFALPFPVKLRTTSIGGPSAGLAMTLGIIDKLWSGRLTGGKEIAATGTIAPTGAVGEVGGIPEKTVAVERAGATVFFVPAAQLKTATSKATPALKVYGVSSLDQVLTDLQHLGGDVPPSHSSHGS